LRSIVQTVVVLGVLLPILLNGQIDPYEIFSRMEAREKPKTTESKMRVTRMKLKRGKEKTKVRELVRYRKFYTQGKYRSKTITKFVKPKIIKGTGILTWSLRKGETIQWLYLPKIRTVKKIEGKDQASSFMNTDFTFEDLAGRALGRDTLIFIEETEIDGFACYKIEAIPLDESQYSKRIIYIDPEINQFRKVEFYGRTGKQVKELVMSKIEVRDNYSSVIEMTMKNLEKKSYTTLELLDVKYNTGLADDFFTEKILIRLN